MKTITPVYPGLTKLVNKAYKFHYENYSGHKNLWGNDLNGFQYDLLHEFGIWLKFAEKEGSGGKGYELVAVDIHDEKKYSMFLLRWA